MRPGRQTPRRPRRGRIASTPARRRGPSGKRQKRAKERRRASAKIGREPRDDRERRRAVAGAGGVLSARSRLIDAARRGLTEARAFGLLRGGGGRGASACGILAGVRSADHLRCTEVRDQRDPRFSRDGRADWANARRHPKDRRRYRIGRPPAAIMPGNPERSRAPAGSSPSGRASRVHLTSQASWISSARDASAATSSTSAPTADSISAGAARPPPGPASASAAERGVASHSQSARALSRGRRSRARASAVSRSSCSATSRAASSVVGAIGHHDPAGCHRRSGSDRTKPTPGSLGNGRGSNGLAWVESLEARRYGLSRNGSLEAEPLGAAT